MNFPVIPFLLFSSLIVFFTVASGLIPLMKRWREDHLHSFVSFSAGVLLATAFILLLPDAVALMDVSQVGFYALLAFSALFVLERFVMLHPCEESHCDYHRIGLAAYIGMMIHTFTDGLALGSAMLVDGLGRSMFLAIIIHKIPSAFALASILRKGEWKPIRIIVFLLLLGLTVPAGTALALFILLPLENPATGLALALSLGTFIYVSTSDFLPEVHRNPENRLGSLLGFFAGLALVIALEQFLPHG